MNPVRLGEGRAEALGAPPKAALLDRAAARGLAVPAGWVLTPGVVGDLVRRGLVAEGEGGCSTPDPAALAAALALPAAGRLAVRSAVAAEDGPDTSMAGRFLTVLDVPAGDDAALAAAITAVLASASGVPAAGRAVLVMEMVAALQAGVAFTERDHEDDLVNWVDGRGDAFVSGARGGRRALLPRLRGRERPRPGHGAPGFAERLQVLLRDVRRVFGAGDWDVEWADDGTTCWLLQVRPVTRPTVRDETFTIANHKEILPPLPSRLMTSMIASCSGDLLDWFRRHDPGVPAGRPLIEVFHGRPMLNLSLLVDMTRAWGVPSRLVTDSLGGGGTGADAGIRPLRLARSAPRLVRMGAAQMRAASASRRTEREILERTADPGRTLAQCIATLRWEYVTLVNQMAALTSASSVPVSLLRRLGTLQEHASRMRTAATAMSDDLGPMRRMAAADPAARALLAGGALPSGAAWERAWREWCDRHGHRGVFESDVARPRNREEPAPVLRMAALPAPGGAPPRRTPLGLATLPLWWAAARPMAAREALRSTAMRGFDRIRARILAIAEEAAAEGRLPAADAVWDLTIEEAVLLDGGGRLPDGLLERRRAEIEADARTPVPDLLRRFGGAGSPGDAPTPGLARGISLTRGTARGSAWVLDEPAAPPAGLPAPVVLVARAVDPGWLPVFAHVAGVVVETGGDLSHGSIILRELGLPAITNAHGATRAFRTGDPIELRAGEGVAVRAAA